MIIATAALVNERVDDCVHEMSEKAFSVEILNNNNNLNKKFM